MDEETKAVAEVATAPSSADPGPTYSKSAQWTIVAIVALAGLFSPLPANIYFPAIPQLAEAFHQSTENINLTVTIYLVFQGISPILWGPFGDRYGRRPVFLLCMTVLVASSIGLAVTPTSAYWLLMLLRCGQSGGSASTIALGAGVISDIADIKEKGTFFGAFNVGPMLAPCIGPIVGGLLAQNLGWRSIFWFLTIASAGCFIAILLFLPETMKGAPRPRTNFVVWLYKPLIPWLPIEADSERLDEDVDDERKKPSRNPFAPFAFPDVVIALSFAGIVYAVNYTITATISSSFETTYPFLSQTELGLCYLPTGFGMLVGCVATGRLLDWDYGRLKAKEVGTGCGLDIEVARLRMMPIHLLVFGAATIGWGWCIQTKASLAAPLVLQILLGYTSIAILNTTMTLMIDVLPSRSAGVTACVNLVRCSLAAILVSVIDRMTDAVGFGWAYVILGLCSIILLPLFYVEMRLGPRWRKRRDSKG